MIHEFAKEVVLVAEFLACVSRSCAMRKDPVALGMLAVILPLLILVYEVEDVVISPLVIAVPAVLL